MKYIVVDLGRVPSGSLSPSSAYVALSWSRGRDSIRLLKDFDDKLFTTHCENSGPRTKRLERLDKLMEEMYDTGFYNSRDL